LEIPVDRDDHRAFSKLDSCRHGRRLTEVSAQTDHPKAGFLRGKLGQRRESPIPATVVDRDHLVTASQQTKLGEQLGQQRIDVRLLVEQRNHHREIHRRTSELLVIGRAGGKLACFLDLHQLGE